MFASLVTKNQYIMRQFFSSIVLLFLLTSCSSGTLSNEEATTAINDYYKDKGCFSRINEDLIDRADTRIQDKVYEVYENPDLKKGKDHKTISWELETINGTQISDDGKSAIVDFTLKGKGNFLIDFQKYRVCGDKDNFGPWDMVAEFIKYDSGWKIKSEPEMK